MPGVYISYPFCNQKCSFCNFASDVGSGAARQQYEARLLTEVQACEWAWEPETLYFGGGTPSLIDPAWLHRLVNEVPTGGLVESTMECAPGTLTDERVAAWLSCRVNRVSLGVQSFDAGELRETGRRHTADGVAADIDLLRRRGIDNINIDLIAGLPHQTALSWTQSLEWVARLDVPHVSVYLFELDEDSRLGKELLLGGKRYGAGDVPSDDAAAGFYEAAVERLAALGYERYEISNFARPGRQSQHNRKYWLLEPYVGFGLDAHSFDGRMRWSNPDTLPAYLNGITEPQRTPARSSEERFFVGLRLMEGIEPTPGEWQLFAEPIAKWTASGMLLQNGHRLRLSPQGVLISNEIFQEFVNG